jgi:hypothetical protein
LFNFFDFLKTPNFGWHFQESGKNKQIRNPIKVSSLKGN